MIRQAVLHNPTQLSNPTYSYRSYEFGLVYITGHQKRFQKAKWSKLRWRQELHPEPRWENLQHSLAPYRGTKGVKGMIKDGKGTRVKGKGKKSREETEKGQSLPASVPRSATDTRICIYVNRIVRQRCWNGL